MQTLYALHLPRWQQIFVWARVVMEVISVSLLEHVQREGKSLQVASWSPSAKALGQGVGSRNQAFRLTGRNQNFRISQLLTNTLWLYLVSFFPGGERRKYCWLGLQGKLMRKTSEYWVSNKLKQFAVIEFGLVEWALDCAATSKHGVSASANSLSWSIETLGRHIPNNQRLPLLCS